MSDTLHSIVVEIETLADSVIQNKAALPYLDADARASIVFEALQRTIELLGRYATLVNAELLVNSVPESVAPEPVTQE